MTSLKGASSMKMHKNSEIRQCTAWHLLRRLRESLMPEFMQVFEGPVDADESYIGGLE